MPTSLRHRASAATLDDSKSPPDSAYSLFEGDATNRIFEALGLRSKGGFGILYRTIALWMLTWVPPAVLFWIWGYAEGAQGRENFFHDVAGLGQCFLGYPLFLYAEQHIDASTRSALKTFISRPILDKRDKSSFTRILVDMHRSKTNLAFDLGWLILGCIFSWLWIKGELSNGVDTWHAWKGQDGREHLSPAGAWAAIIGVPIFNFWWLRFFGKCLLWSQVLWKLSRLRLILVPTHPDKTAGLYFISKTQTSFGAAIFAFGISAIAATIGHKLVVEHANPLIFAVWGPIVGYILIAPLIFTLPLFAFTPQLKALKKTTMERFNQQLSRLSQQFEKEWLHAKGDSKDLVAPEISAMADITNAYQTAQKLRVIPFDFESMSKLLVATVSPFLPLANWLGVMPPQIQEFGGFLKEVLSKLNWHG